jgi:hypothetical protein
MIIYLNASRAPEASVSHLRDRRSDVEIPDAHQAGASIETGSSTIAPPWE